MGLIERYRRQLAAAGIAAVTLGLAPPAAAQTGDGAFQGKTVTIIIGYAPGGLYDLTARLLSRHMGRHIPGNPSVVPQNMVGASSYKAIMHLYSVAPKDGTTIGMISRGFANDNNLSPEMGNYDPTQLRAIGSTSSEVSVAVVWHTAAVKTFQDTLNREFTVGSTGLNSPEARFAVLVKNLTGSKIKIVTGYPGGNDVTLAMERGEVDGRFGWSWGSVKSRAKPWLDEKKINIIFQMGLAKAPDLPDTPFIMDFARNDLDRRALELLTAQQAFAWPLIAPRGIDADRLMMLRRAFDSTVKDEQFLSEAKKLDIEIEPMTGEDMDVIIKRINSFDAAVVQHALTLVKEK